MSEWHDQEARSTGRPLVDLLRRLAAVVFDQAASDALEALAKQIHQEPPGSEAVLDRLVTSFGLSRFERDVLVLAGLPEEHEAVTLATRQLNPTGASRLTFGVVAEVLQLDHEGRRQLRRSLEAGALARCGLVTGDESTPLPERSLRLATGLWSEIRGVGSWPTGIRLRPAQPLPTTLRTESFGRALRPGRRLVLVIGEGHRGLDDIAGEVAAVIGACGSQAVFVEAESAVAETSSLLSAHAVARGVCPVVVGHPTAAPLPDHPGPVVLCVDDVSGIALDDRAVVPFELRARSFGEHVEMWGGLVPELNGGASLLAGMVRVDHLRASRAVADARALASSDGGTIDVAAIVSQVRRRSDTALPRSVRLVRPTTEWDALVTSASVEDLLQSVVDRVVGQAKVLHEWGFERTRHSRGTRAMFAGPPGTGKTMSAEIIAGVLGLDLLVVDLSALVSKWLGETEKNISEVFDTAERCQAVLFFDEADAIFARRTDGGDAQGRWANLETAHLLGRMEEFEGLVVLATNLRGHIDDAFVRRLDVIIDFEEPDRDERRRLWAAHLPEAAPMGPDVDLDMLADLYQITGGLIRNASLDAAYRAAARSEAIDQRGLIHSIEREFIKAGRSFPGVPRALQQVRIQNAVPSSAQGA